MGKNQHTDIGTTATASGDIIERPWFAWTLWIASLVVNAVGVFLWLVFGLAAAAGASTSEFVGGTAVGVAISVGTSLLALLLKRHIIAIILIWAMLPIVFLLLLSMRSGS